MSNYEYLEPPDDIFLFRTQEWKKQREFNIIVCPAKPDYYSKEGGIHCYIPGRKYPTNGYPFEEIVRAVDIVKRVLISGVKLLSSNPIRYFLILLAFVPKSVLMKIFDSVIGELESMNSRLLKWWILKPERYCESGREIYRVVEKMIKKRFFENKIRKWMWSLYLFCMIWEFDTFYRWIGQDIFGEIDKERMLNDPAREIGRILDILMKRTEMDALKTKWRAIRFIIFWSVSTKGWIRDLIKEFFEEIDLKKVKLSNVDTYYAYEKVGYNFGDKTREERLKIRQTI